MPDGRTILVPVFLFAQAWLVHWAGAGDRPPTPPVLSSFPAQVGQWEEMREDPIAADVAAELRASQILSRTYRHASTGSAASLFVAWFQSQRAGSQPHSPKVCLPAAGWTPAVTGEVTLSTAAGTITVNRYIVVNRGQRDVVLYWYQGPRRVTAGEWKTKLWLMADALRDQRTDTALVRVVVPSGNQGDQAATVVACNFARILYPLLQEKLPRISASARPGSDTRFLVAKIRVQCPSTGSRSG
jgi:EpsI family protein